MVFVALALGSVVLFMRRASSDRVEYDKRRAAEEKLKVADELARRRATEAIESERIEDARRAAILERLGDAISKDDLDRITVIVAEEDAQWALNKALEAALSQRKLPAAKLLLTLGADPNPPLRTAVGNWDIALARMLLKAGADPNEAMSYALMRGPSLEIIQLLLAHGADVVKGQTSTRSPLINDAIYGALRRASDYQLQEGYAIIRLLISHGASVGPAIKHVEKEIADLHRIAPLGEGPVKTKRDVVHRALRAASLDDLGLTRLHDVLAMLKHEAR